jgi:hypothetical protein
MAILVVNLVFCVIILAFGIWGYIKKKGDVSLYIGLAFFLYGVSHLLNILGLAAEMNSLIITIRFLAYLLVIFALYRLLSRK